MLRKPGISKSEVIQSAGLQLEKENAARPRTTMPLQTKMPRLLIYCEGETEKQYLTTIVNALQIQNHVAIRNTAACDPMSLLEAAYKEFQWSQVADKASPFTEYWLVFDRDHHQTYDAIFQMAENMSSSPHLCWTNPCIEFWFWLHYTDNTAKLQFDDRIEVFHEEKQQDLGNGILEITTVRRLQQTVKPETMLSILKTLCPKYSKARCPADLVSRSRVACERLQKVAQSSNPLAMGSAMPLLLQRLTELSDTLHPKKEAPSPTTSVAPTIPSAPEPENPWQPLMEPLRQCLADWPHITLHNGTLTAPEATFTHFETFLTTAAASKIDRKIRARGRSGLNCLKNLIKLVEPGCKATKKVTKITGKLTVLGQLLTSFAKLMGLDEEIALLDFDKSDLAFTKQSSAAAAPQPAVKTTKPETPAVEGPFSDEAPDPQTLLTEKLQSLKSLRGRLKTVLDCLSVSDQGTPQELLPGVCEKAAMLTTEATVLVNAVNALLSDDSEAVPHTMSDDVWQAMIDDYNAYLEYGRD